MLWNWTYWIASLATAFYVTPLLLARLGVPLYGAWVLLGSILGYYSFLNFGLDTAVLRYVAAHLGEDRADEAQRVIATGRGAFRLVSLAVALTSGGLAALLWLWDAPFRESLGAGALRREIALSLAVLGAGATASVLGRVPVAVLRAKERYDLLNVVNLGALALRTLAIVFWIDGSLIRLSAAFATASALAALGSSLAARRLMPPDRIARRGFDWSTFRRVRGYGWFAFLNFVAEHLRFHTDALVIGQFLRLSAVTHFNLGATLIGYLRSVIAQASAPLLPVLSRRHGAGDARALRETFLVASRVIALLAGLAAGTLAGTGERFLELWVGTSLGADATALAYRVMLVLLAPILLELAGSVATQLIFARGAHRKLFSVNGAEAAANLALSLLLVERFGVVGVAVGTAAPLAVTRLVVLPRLACSLVEADVGRYLRACLMPSIVVAVGLGLAQRAAVAAVRPEGYLVLAAVALTTLAAAAVPASLWMLGASERRYLGSLLPGRGEAPGSAPGRVEGYEASSG